MRTCDHVDWFANPQRCTREAVRRSISDIGRVSDQNAHWYCLTHWYPEYLRSAYWKKVRENVLRTRGKRCELCGTGRFSSTVLHVHHLTYERVGAEQADDLAVLCRDCHKSLHSLPKEDHVRSLKAIRLTTNFADYKTFVAGGELPISRLDPHWVARYQL